MKGTRIGPFEWGRRVCVFLDRPRARGAGLTLTLTLRKKERVNPARWLAFARYCYYQNCMVYGIQKVGRQGSNIA